MTTISGNHETDAKNGSTPVSQQEEALNKIQANFPEELIVFEQLDEVCSASKFKFQIFSSTEKEITWFSDQHLELDGGKQPFECFVKFDASVHTICIEYKPLIEKISLSTGIIPHITSTR